MVIDELVVVLGLDARKFTQEQRDAVDSFRRSSLEVERLGGRVESSAERMGTSLGIVRKGALGLLGAFAGGEAAAFIDHVINMDAATGRMAKTIDDNVANLGIWQSMIRQVGGSAEEATSALSAMQDTINNVRQGNGLFDDKTAFLLTKIGGLQGRNADQVFRDLQKYFAGEVGSGRMNASTAASEMRWLPGMNQSMINLLLSDFQKIEEAARKVGGATEESAEAAQKLQGAFSLMIQAMERFGASMLPIISLLLKPLNQLGKDDLKNVLPDDPSHPLFEPGGVLDRFWRWQYKLIQGVDPGATAAGGPGGGSRGDRNNNPGNMKYGDFARSHGATGADSGGFAVFPDWATGSAAQERLVRGSSYQGLTLDQFAQKYAEGSSAWRNTVGGALGIGGGDIVNNQDPRLIEAIRRAEGTGARGAAGSRTGGSSRTSTSSSEVHIGSIAVNAPNATDADGIAHEMGNAIKRSAITSPANTALV